MACVCCCERTDLKVAASLGVKMKGLTECFLASAASPRGLIVPITLRCPITQPSHLSAVLHHGPASGHGSVNTSMTTVGSSQRHKGHRNTHAGHVLPKPPLGDSCGDDAEFVVPDPVPGFFPDAIAAPPLDRVKLNIDQVRRQRWC